jgi:hypothetical protein
MGRYYCSMGAVGRVLWTGVLYIQTPGDYSDMILQIGYCSSGVLFTKLDRAEFGIL